MTRPPRLLLIPIALAMLLAAAGDAAASQSSAERALAAAERLFASGPATTSALAPEGREATPILRDLARALPELRGADRRRARQLLARPDQPTDSQGDYFGAEAAASPICDSHFCVHWSTKAANAPLPGDSSPSNGVPDFADAVIGAAQDSYVVENASLGWRDAKSDGARGAKDGRGGAGQVDVYLTDLGTHLFGYATTDPGHYGRREPGYLVLDNDYKGFNGDPVELMQVTMAHEYNHVLQFNYDTYTDTWMFESTATWVEEMVYPAINDYLRFTNDFSQLPFEPLAERESAGVKLYGSALWNHWLSSRLGAATVRAAWEAAPKVKPRDFAVAAYDRAIAAAGGRSFSRQFAKFAALTAEINANAVLPDAGLYDDVVRSGSLTGRAKKLKLDHTAYRLYRVKAAGRPKLVARIKRRTHAAIALVGLNGPAVGGKATIVSKYLPKGGKGSVALPRAASYDRVTAVLINADGRARGANRRYTRDGRTVKARIKRR